ncbi:hypothetical protein EJ04DRAFT_137056 [Polyplosphaeria fusca]|uniref:Uncharacterized protein n=1 Tax=Polyplosphaeria fusca TaxID=682080 RepID=A0A9P4UWT2_9PLEO|nr:hypothetical protein EJ04DRAFT_137056 [Polyplosphaeria fusca]
MKRKAPEDGTVRKRCRALSHGSAPTSSHWSKCMQPASQTTPPVPPQTPKSLSSVQAQIQWEDRARFISDWACSVPTSQSSSKSNESSPRRDVQAPDTMSEGSRLRNIKTQQRRPRFCSPTKKSPQYRNTVLKPANILVDVVHVLPPDVESLLPFDLRDVLDPPSPVSKHTCHNAGLEARKRCLLGLECI